MDGKRCDRSSIRKSWIVAVGILSTLLGSVSIAEVSPKSQEVSRVGFVLEGDSLESYIIESLCRMRLYESAIARCRAEIAAASDASMVAAKWTALLIATQAAQSVEMAKSVEVAIAESQKTYDAFVAQESNRTAIAWVSYAFERERYQLANRSVAGYLAAPTNIFRRDDGLTTIRSILDRLSKLRELVQDQLGEYLRKTDRESMSIAGDLSSLRNRIALLELDCYLLRCECYPDRSDEQIAAGTDAFEAVEKVGAQVDPQWQGRPLLELARFQSLLALRRYPEVIKGLEKWIPTAPSTRLRYRGVAMVVKAAQGEGDSATAERLLASIPAYALMQVPEIALVKLGQRIDRWKIRTSGKPSPSSATENDAEVRDILAEKDQIAARFGSYWEQRAEALIVSASLILPQSSASTAPSTSMELLKMEIRQRIAAGDRAGAIERLEQAEASAYAAHHIDQAFQFAKAALGLAQQQAGQAASVSLESQQAVVDRMASVARKYAELDEAVALHRHAIDSQRNLMADSAEDRAKRSRAYQQLLEEHLTIWPLDPTSDSAREALQQLHLGLGNGKGLVDVWRDALAALMASNPLADEASSRSSPMVTWQANLANAKLLASIASGHSSAFPTASAELMKESQSTYDWLAETLSSDFTWWTLDGGLRPSDGAPIDWSKATSVAGEPFHLDRIATAILLAAKQGTATSVDTELQQWWEWGNVPSIDRLGWIAAMGATLSEILRLRMGIEEERNEVLTWIEPFARMRSLLQSSVDGHGERLPPSLHKIFRQQIDWMGARISAMQGELQTGVAQVEELRKQEPRNPRWILELARLYEIRGGSDTEKGLQRYRQLAAGSAIGSDGWLEARLSAVRCLRKMGKAEEADQALSLLKAMLPSTPEKWKRRLK